MVKGNGVLYRSPLFQYRYILMFSFLTGMASITISPVSSSPFASNANVTGDEKLIVINKGGKTSTISVNQIIDKMDDDIIDRIDDPILEMVEDQIADMIEDRLDDIDPGNTNLNWNEVYD